jgi:hypothetical protein
MCFPTPRDSTTDLVNTLFNAHVNLSPTNKSAVVEKIMQARADFILFADAALDSRVFALAHERLALHQGRVESRELIFLHINPSSIAYLYHPDIHASICCMHLIHLLSHPSIHSSIHSSNIHLIYLLYPSHPSIHLIHSSGALWHYGGSLGIPTVDYYFMPEIFWQHSQCGLGTLKVCDRVARSSSLR